MCAKRQGRHSQPRTVPRHDLHAGMVPGNYQQRGFPIHNGVEVLVAETPHSQFLSYKPAIYNPTSFSTCGFLAAGAELLAARKRRSRKLQGVKCRR